uniref:Uncharacterized protein n=1 Tax=Rangifer tarandus platyrhynchus TaxID=3082113 RepID=A0ACB0EJU9_RANTA|nr:unnamed protein product [Rangifer tarandus platyrhynchus]
MGKGEQSLARLSYRQALTTVAKRRSSRWSWNMGFSCELGAALLSLTDLTGQIEPSPGVRQLRPRLLQTLHMLAGVCFRLGVGHVITIQLRDSPQNAFLFSDLTASTASRDQAQADRAGYSLLVKQGP